MADHIHRTTILLVEKYRQPLVPGTATRTFKYPVCGGRDGCGAIFMNDKWFVNVEMAALYEAGRERLERSHDA